MSRRDSARAGPTAVLSPAQLCHGPRALDRGRGLFPLCSVSWGGGWDSAPPRREEVTASLRHEGCTSSGRFLGCLLFPATGRDASRPGVGLGVLGRISLSPGWLACLGDCFPAPSPGSTAAEAWKHRLGLTRAGIHPGGKSCTGMTCALPLRALPWISPPQSTSPAPGAPMGLHGPRCCSRRLRCLGTGSACCPHTRDPLPGHGSTFAELTLGKGPSFGCVFQSLPGVPAPQVVAASWHLLEHFGPGCPWPGYPLPAGLLSVWPACLPGGCGGQMGSAVRGAGGEPGTQWPLPARPSSPFKAWLASSSLTWPGTEGDGGGDLALASISVIQP